MRTQSFALLTTVLWILSDDAAAFTSGSDGTDGALVVTEDTTLPLPSDGSFHFTTVTVEAGVTLTFERNPLNTPVTILASGDVLVLGTIDVSGGDATTSPAGPGPGGPGGFDGGWPQLDAAGPGDGQGPGGGRAGPDAPVVWPNCSDFESFGQPFVGAGSFGGLPAAPGPLDGATYGSDLLVPLVGGSGGGGMPGTPGRGGGGGGGAVLVASSTRIDLDIAGAILARGGKSLRCNPGSGGAVRLVAPVIAGAGLIDVTGGYRETPSPYQSTAPGETGGAGRIRVDALDRSGIAFRTEPGSAAFGSLLLVTPVPAPTVTLVEAAGQVLGAGAAAELVLPFDAELNQPVVVEVAGFTGLVRVTVAVTPQAGSSRAHELEIDATNGGPTQGTVIIELAPNTINDVRAWVE